MKKFITIAATFVIFIALTMPANATQSYHNGMNATSISNSESIATGGNSSSRSSASGGQASAGATAVNGSISPIQTTNTNVGGATGGAVNFQDPLYQDNSYHEAADLNRSRGFAISGDVQYGPVLNYFGQPLPSEGFQPIEDIIMYACWYTEGALKSMLKHVENVDAEFKVSSLNIEDAHLAEDGETRWIKVILSRTKYKGTNVDFKGFVTARSKHRETTMVETMAKAAMLAVKNGCNVIHFSAQGAVRDVESSGWGIGFNTTQASLNGSDLTHANVTSGGFGISKATAGTRDKPWLQGFGLIDRDLVYPTLK